MDISLIYKLDESIVSTNLHNTIAASKGTPGYNRWNYAYESRYLRYALCIIELHQTPVSQANLSCKGGLRPVNGIASLDPLFEYYPTYT